MPRATAVPAAWWRGELFLINDRNYKILVGDEDWVTNLDHFNIGAKLIDFLV